MRFSGFPYASGDMEGDRRHPETVVPDLPAGPNHFSRGVAFSLDGKKMYISVGSHNNVTDIDTDKSEFHRADILVGDPDGKNLDVYATTAFAMVPGVTVNPTTGELWTSVNERDELGDNIPPDYIHARAGRGFLRLALVLHRRPSRPALPGKTSRVEGQSDRARRHG